MNKALITIPLVYTLCACSNQAAYNTMQENLKEQCRRQPPAQQERCLEEIQDDYEEYRRQREEVLGD